MSFYQRSHALPAWQYGNPAFVLEIQQEKTRFDDRVDNWRRVARDRFWCSATCWSAEGRYVAPSDDAAALPEEDLIEAAKRFRSANPWPSDPDIARRLLADAWLFEDCWRFLPDEPKPFRRLLALFYHRHGLSPRRIGVSLGIRRDQFDDVLRKARAMLRNRVRTFDRPDPNLTTLPVRAYSAFPAAEPGQNVQLGREGSVSTVQQAPVGQATRE